MSSKAIPKLTSDQYDDRIEWLMSAAPLELKTAVVSYTPRVWRADKIQAICELLDEMSRSAEQCAKYLRAAVGQLPDLAEDEAKDPELVPSTRFLEAD